ncbi:MAG: OmpH family outer membrane protein [Gammaproteobacteria bacterium]|nr:MAG: OmpH family outer membrane protein [Gammaproteobacteria bacterium]
MTGEGGPGWLGVFLAAVAAVGVSVWVSYVQFERAGGPAILVLDSEAIVEAKIEAIKAAAMAGKDTLDEQQAFVKKIDALMEKYAREGYIVLNRAAAVAFPDTIDITLLVAEALGVHIKGERP